MNKFLPRNNFIRCAWLVAVLFTAGLLLPALRAQPTEQTVRSRYLFIFDTSANMKNRLPAAQKALAAMLATSMGGQMHAGDSIGVWTFNQDLHPGDFPLQVWDPDDAATIASKLTQFLGGQKYANKTRFEALQPNLNRLLRSSERLTVIIFCDGATKISGTTFDTGINQLLEQNAAAQKKARQPFIVLLRSQLGKYVGCTVSYAPQPVSYPQFPPLPLPPPPPPAPAPKPLPVVVPPPVVNTPSLMITGTNIENRLAPPLEMPAPTNPPPIIEPAPASLAPTNAPVVAQISVPAAAPVVPSNPPPMPAAVPPIVAVMPTNPPAVPPVNPPTAPAVVPVIISPANPIAPSNAPAIIAPVISAMPSNVPTPALKTNSVVAAETVRDKKPLVIGTICLAAAGLLTAWVALRFRRPDPRSLISRSMHDK